MALEPVIVTCTADTWVKVSPVGGMTSGIIWKRSVSPGVYKQTFRLAGNAAPTDDSDAVLIFGNCDSVIISESALVDVYIKAVKVAGEVRVDA